MNTEILELLMKEKKIKSYYQLAKEMNIPYTSLLDIVHGKGLKITNMKMIANFFDISIDCLTSKTTYYYVIKEDNTLQKYLPLTKDEQAKRFLLPLFQENVL